MLILKEARRGCETSGGAAGTGGYKPSHVGAGNQTQALFRVLLVTEPSF